jgi:hypothetical protein
MLKAPKPSVLASLSYFIAAAIPIGAWAIMLLTATPEKLTLVQSIASQLEYTFSDENSHRWWFITWASAPLLLLALSASYFRGPPKQAWLANTLLAFGGGVVAVSAYLWPSTFLPAAVGMYCAFRARSEA